MLCSLLSIFRTIRRTRPLQQTYLIYCTEARKLDIDESIKNIVYKEIMSITLEHITNLRESQHKCQKSATRLNHLVSDLYHLAKDARDTTTQIKAMLSKCTSFKFVPCVPDIETIIRRFKFQIQLRHDPTDQQNDIDLLNCYLYFCYKFEYIKKFYEFGVLSQKQEQNKRKRDELQRELLIAKNKYTLQANKLKDELKYYIQSLATYTDGQYSLSQHFVTILEKEAEQITKLLPIIVTTSELDIKYIEKKINMTTTQCIESTIDVEQLEYDELVSIYHLLTYYLENHINPKMDQILAYLNAPNEMNDGYRISANREAAETALQQINIQVLRNGVFLREVQLHHKFLLETYIYLFRKSILLKWINFFIKQLIVDPNNESETEYLREYVISLDIEYQTAINLFKPSLHQYATLIMTNRKKNYKLEFIPTIKEIDDILTRTDTVNKILIQHALNPKEPTLLTFEEIDNIYNNNKEDLMMINECITQNFRTYDNKEVLEKLKTLNVLNDYDQYSLTDLQNILRNLQNKLKQQPTDQDLQKKIYLLIHYMYLFANEAYIVNTFYYLHLLITSSVDMQISIKQASLFCSQSLHCIEIERFKTIIPQYNNLFKDDMDHLKGGLEKEEDITERYDNIVKKHEIDRLYINQKILLNTSLIEATTLTIEQVENGNDDILLAMKCAMSTNMIFLENSSDKLLEILRDLNVLSFIDKCDVIGDGIDTVAPFQDLDDSHIDNPFELLTSVNDQWQEFQPFTTDVKKKNLEQSQDLNMSSVTESCDLRDYCKEQLKQFEIELRQKNQNNTDLQYNVYLLIHYIYLDSRRQYLRVSLDIVLSKIQDIHKTKAIKKQKKHSTKNKKKHSTKNTKKQQTFSQQSQIIEIKESILAKMLYYQGVYIASTKRLHNIMPEYKALLKAFQKPLKANENQLLQELDMEIQLVDLYDKMLQKNDQDVKYVEKKIYEQLKSKQITSYTFLKNEELDMLENNINHNTLYYIKGLLMNYFAIHLEIKQDQLLERLQELKVLKDGKNDIKNIQNTLKKLNKELKKLKTQGKEVDIMLQNNIYLLILYLYILHKNQHTRSLVAFIDEVIDPMKQQSSEKYLKAKNDAELHREQYESEIAKIKSSLLEYATFVNEHKNNQAITEFIPTIKEIEDVLGKINNQQEREFIYTVFSEQEINKKKEKTNIIPKQTITEDEILKTQEGYVATDALVKVKNVQKMVSHLAQNSFPEESKTETITGFIKQKIPMPTIEEEETVEEETEINHYK